MGTSSKTALPVSSVCTVTSTFVPAMLVPCSLKLIPWTNPSSDDFMTTTLPFFNILSNVTETVCPLITVTCCELTGTYLSGVSTSVTVYVPGASPCIFICPLLSVVTVSSTPFPVILNFIFSTWPSSLSFFMLRSPFNVTENDSSRGIVSTFP